ncbi:MAG: hypothetical protein WCR02_12910, partial [Sphaerochaetaceae bacterium]
IFGDKSQSDCEYWGDKPPNAKTFHIYLEYDFFAYYTTALEQKYRSFISRHSNPIHIVIKITLT